MREWLLSLHPRHWDAMVSGTKRYELRRRVPRGMQPGDAVHVYVTKPVGQLVGLFGCARVHRFASVDDLLSLVTGHVSSTSEGEIRDYFAGAKECCAIELGAIEEHEPRELGKHPPQGVIGWRRRSER